MRPAPWFSLSLERYFPEYICPFINMYIQRQNDAYKPTNKCGRVLKITEVTQFFIKGMLYYSL